MSVLISTWTYFPGQRIMTTLVTSVPCRYDLSIPNRSFQLGAFFLLKIYTSPTMNWLSTVFILICSNSSSDEVIRSPSLHVCMLFVYSLDSILRAVLLIRCYATGVPDSILRRCVACCRTGINNLRVSSLSIGTRYTPWCAHSLLVMRVVFDVTNFMASN